MSESLLAVDSLDMATLRRMADCLPHMLLICAADGSCEYSNRCWCDYTGAATPDMGWLERVHGEDQATLRQHWQTLACRSDAVRLQARIRDCRQGYRRFDIHVTPLLIGGRVAKWLVSHCQAGEQQQASLELLQQQELLQRISSLAHVGGWSRDTRTGVLSWTEEVAAMHGLDSSQILSSQMFEALYDADSHTLMNAALHQALTHAEIFEIEIPLQRPGQPTKWFRSHGKPVVMDGRVVRIDGVMQDVTERKCAELEVLKLNRELEHQVALRTAELEHARADLQNLMNALPIMIVCWDTDLRVRYANRSFAQEHGHTLEGVRGLHITEVLPAEIYGGCIPRIRQTLSGEAHQSEAFLCMPGTLRSFNAEIYYQPYVVDGTVRGAISLVLDVTNRKRAELELLHANRELEAFAYAVAHDLRAPLRALSGFSSALLEDYGVGMAPDAHLLTAEINRASTRMGELLEGLLILSRSTQGALQRDYVDLSAIATMALEELQQLEPQRQVHWQITPGLIGFGDKRMLAAVLRNLLSNAWKYTQRTQPAHIRFEQVAHEGQRMFCVSDNGVGFDMAHADRLFHPFQRLHRQDEFPGIGIGLATVKRIINRHGGELTAAAAPGKGARFSFTLGARPGEHDT